jgi:prevent-host-death family protein
MTYSMWKLSDAKARFSEAVSACAESPQLLCNRGKPVAALIDIESFRAYRRFEEQAQCPSMASLLAELDVLNEEEGDFGEAPQRVNRPQDDREDREN